MSFRTVSVFGARFAFAKGRLPWHWSRGGPWGVAVAPPISPYTGPDWSPFCRVPWLLRSVFFCLPCGIPPVFMVIIWSVSLTPACPLRVTPVWGCSLDTCIACDWLALLSSSTLFQDSCHLRWLLVATVRSSYLLRKTPVSLPRLRWV